MNTVKYGYEIEFETEHCDMCKRSEIKFNSKEISIISELLQKLYEKEIIEESVHEEGDIISHVFL